MSGANPGAIVTVPAIAVVVGLGFFEICGTNDRKKKIKESDEANNKTCITIEGV